jgi:hypothetical protein
MTLPVVVESLKSPIFEASLSHVPEKLETVLAT